MSRIGHESEPPRSTLRRLGREHGQVVAPSGSFFPLRVGCRHECAQRGLEQGRIGREGGNAMKSVQTGTLLPAIPSESSVEQELRAAIQRSESELTIADLVVATGMPRRCIEEALTRLTGEYRCGAAVTESGELLYRFAGRAETTTGTSPTAVRVSQGCCRRLMVNQARGWAWRFRYHAGCLAAPPSEPTRTTSFPQTK